MRSSFKNTILLLFRRIDKAIFHVYRKSLRMRSMEIPKWAVFVMIIVSYTYIFFTLFLPLFRSEIRFFFYVSIIGILIITLLYSILLKAFVSQLLGYRNPYPVRKSPLDPKRSEERPPFRYVGFVNEINTGSSRIFLEYLSTNEDDFQQLLKGGNLTEKMIWLPLTDRKLPNFRLFFHFLNYITEENLEGYYGENLLRLCQYITRNFRSKDTDWSVKQLQKAHSGWKGCSPKRRMDLTIDIENHFLPSGRS